ncbi:M48 family metalloprotease [Nonomuraea sp. NPDC049129]|uniref:M56 family metallopeptidase n=1 Tax=Nonomuraea sp. NPDC049129 TaxID=3155272 RepID=UPI0033F3DF7A
MIVEGALVAHAAITAWGLPRLIMRSQRLRDSPRLSIAAWLAGCASVIASGALAGLQLAFPAHAIGDEVAALIMACGEMLSGHVSPFTARPLAALAGLSIAGGIAIRVGWASLTVLWTGRRCRIRHRKAVRLIGRERQELGALVVQHDEPAAYCVPGRRAVIVITSGALAALDHRQVAAVLAHERAHVTGRHHLLLTAAQVAAKAFPGLPVFAATGTAVPHLVELLADDVAARKHARGVIASALIAVARASTPAATLGAGGESTVTRVKRLLSPVTPACGRDRVLGILGVSGLLAAPGFALIVPSLITFLISCPVIG